MTEKRIRAAEAVLQEKWFVETKRADFEGIGRKFGISPVLARIIRNRDVISEQGVDYYLNGTLENLHDPHLLYGMEQGTDILMEKISAGKSIRIIGDYDVDGICSTYILKKALSVLGADVSAAIPHRIRDGYGLNEHLIREAYDDNIDVIVTCDNGIAAADEIALAKKLGMTVIVTDHHEVPYDEVTEGGESKRRQRLPEADAVIDPKQEDCSYPYDGICGAFVAYKLVQVLFEKAQKAGKVTPETAAQTVRELTEPAAIATICDVMQLLDENRILVKYGLRFMEQSENLGIRTLLDVCGISSAKLTNYHIGFIVGPCLNATGRLDSAMRGLELLEAQKEREAVVLATELKEMNESRKALTEQATEEAVRQVEEGELQENTVLVIYLPDCHESIAGIVAGRIREKYNRPVFVVTDAEDGLKGSGRSIEAYHMYEGLHAVEELLGKYGGHKLAAGFSLPKENLQEFKRQLNAQSRLTEEDFVKRVMIDVPMPVRYASVEFVNELSRLEPFGNGNPKPVFADRALHVSQLAVRGKNRNVAGFQLQDAGGFSVEGIYFGEADRFVQDVTEHGSCINILYYPQVNTFRGKTTLQIVVTSYQFPAK